MNDIPELAERQQQQDFAGIASRLRLYVPLVAVTTLIGVALMGVVSYFMPQRYTASAELVFAPQGNMVKQPGVPDQPLSDQARDAAIDSQIQMVKSLPVAIDTVRRLHLEKDAELVDDSQRYQAKMPGRVDALGAALLANVKSSRVGQTTLFDVSYTGKDPLEAAEIANVIVDVYLNHQVAQKLSQTRDNTSLLGSRIEELRQQAQQADAAVARYKASKDPMAGATAPDGTDPTTQEISALNQQLAIARAQEAEVTERYNAAQRAMANGGGGGDIGDALSSQVISDLRSQRAQVARKVAELQTRYGERYPDLIIAKQELSAIDDQINAEIKRIASNLAAQVKVAQQHTGSLEQSLGGARGRLASNIDSSVDLGDLQRRATAARTLYENFLSSNQQQAASQALVQPDARINTAATPPLRPSSPNIPVNLFVGFVVGAAIGVAISWIRERWSVALNTIDDVPRLLDQNFLNSVPTLKSSVETPATEDPAEAVLEHPLSVYAEAFRSLATSLLYAPADKPVKVIGLTSALPKEGKTTTAVAIARVLALSGSKVLLLDADMRRRSATQLVAPDATAGLIEVLSGELPLEKALVDDKSGARVLPIAPGGKLTQQPFDTPQFADLMARLRQQFDIVVVDTAPVLAVVDTRILTRHLDSLAMLARWRKTPVKAIRAAIYQIESVGGRIRGVAMTLVNLKAQASSGYGDPSYYYADMKDYYAR